ncbi:hypothetical protein L6452_15852 [Arctium lappa]|uniref:Uncharacterized protein n=1 Tax=Arctium lappa TaxID=4217 RepID=A0ACB9CPP6_ARCLA|nr:hypothetical protein L6452_15852 [Arctium lappa]
MDCWSPSLNVDLEFAKLVNRMHPPRVTVDNITYRNATLIKVDSANKRGSLLEVVQVLTNLNILIKRVYISSDGQWFMDVFHVSSSNFFRSIELKKNHWRGLIVAGSGYCRG